MAEASVIVKAYPITKNPKFPTVPEGFSEPFRIVIVITLCYAFFPRKSEPVNEVLAREFLLEPSSLRRRLEAPHGILPDRHLREKRMSRAAAKLMDERLRVHDSSTGF
jgi:methylphosphotriester-DNA--protein-cysteine methyltransferase